MAWDLAPHMVCSQCGGKSVSFTFNSLGVPTARRP